MSLLKQKLKKQWCKSKFKKRLMFIAFEWKKTHLIDKGDN